MERYILSSEEEKKIRRCFKEIPKCKIYICEFYPDTLDDIDCENVIKEGYMKHSWSDEGGCFIPGYVEKVVIIKNKGSLFHEIAHVFNYNLLCKAFEVESKYDLKDSDKLFYNYISDFLAEYYSCLIKDVDVKNSMIEKEQYKPLRYRLGMRQYMRDKYPNNVYGIDEGYKLFVSSFIFSLTKIEIVDRKVFDYFVEKYLKNCKK